MIRILSESTAACIAYGTIGPAKESKGGENMDVDDISDKTEETNQQETEIGKSEKIVLMFDLGGGFLNVSAVAIDGGNSFGDIHPKATPNLGDGSTESINRHSPSVGHVWDRC